MARNYAPSMYWHEPDATSEAVTTAEVFLVDNGSGKLVIDDAGPAEVWLQDSGGKWHPSDTSSGAAKLFAAAKVLIFG